jgi:hypothetical protein
MDAPNTSIMRNSGQGVLWCIGKADSASQTPTTFHMTMAAQAPRPRPRTTRCAHFDSKEHLVQQVLAIEAGLVQALHRAAEAEDSRAAGLETLADYIDPAQPENVASGCLLVAHPVDAIRGDTGRKDGYTQRLTSVIEAARAILGDDGSHDDARRSARNRRRATERSELRPPPRRPHGGGVPQAPPVIACRLCRGGFGPRPDMVLRDLRPFWGFAAVREDG